MPRIRITQPVQGVLQPGMIVETVGPVTAIMQAWLAGGQAELLFERVPLMPDDDGQVPPLPPRRG
jgi:hypothetical protein